MRKLMSLIVAGTMLASGAAAQAQGWDRGYDRDGDRGNAGPARAVCSGARAQQLEGRLNHEQQEGELDPRSAWQMHRAIDQLEAKARHECSEGDQRDIWQIAARYNGIEQQLEYRAHGGWDRRW